MVSAGGSAARMSSAPSPSRAASTMARAAMEAAWRAISSCSCALVTGTPSAREKVPMRRRLSIRPWAARAEALSWLATMPVTPATTANTTTAIRSRGWSMVNW